ncbi:NAC domain-containing protein 104-like isoform X1 [Musa acuminata AAA Group]|uniref:NAC domain-containing protein 104-like isoform X1 n=1 Tax=Musa acuminata AAA Group TaxID=214697 RepID=UPI0031DE75C0
MGEGSSSLPPGFQFFPSDEELVLHFLHRKAALLPCHPDIIPTIDLHHCDPWDLGGKALQGGNRHWYFFTHTTQSRATATGYWHAAGTDHETIASSCVDVGVKKTLRYYLGEAPEGVKTNWLMHEYHLLDDGVLHSTGDGGTRKKVSDSAQAMQEPRLVHSTTTIAVQESNRWVVCRVYESTGGSQSSFHDDGGSELSCLDEVFLSLDDIDEISLPN